MDLGTMEERLNSRRYYITLNMFAADFYKMVKNCQVRSTLSPGLPHFIRDGKVVVEAGFLSQSVTCWLVLLTAQLYNGATNPYFLAAKRIYEVFWSVMRSSILPNLEAAGIVEPKL